MLNETERVLRVRGYAEIGKENDRIYYGHAKAFVKTDQGHPFVLNPEGEVSATLFDHPEDLQKVFEKGGFKTIHPISVINKGGTTMFVSAGIQTLENVFHHDHSLPETAHFVAQPVFRTQYIESPKEGFCSTFINIATVAAGKSIQEHTANFDFWLSFLIERGLKPSNFQFVSEQKQEKWGDKKITIDILRVNYDGLPIGDANFISSFPQKSRLPFSVSDIGFGLERVRWILAGGKFWDGIYGKVTGTYDPAVLDACNTVALLAGSGLKPSNNEAGYRFRKLSKRLITLVGGRTQQLLDKISTQYGRWSNWAAYFINKEKAMHTVEIENDRNLNALILNRLREMGYKDVGIDINLSTTKLISLLRGTSAKPQDVQDVLHTLEISHE